ncbi:hypothetical protein [Frankia tisae]|uniref:hypothetical protein n=1 Tax=Frankia tisae TaxID=2950104 RepID=UPI0021C22F06|nr:hypothetical protein [Frankia tisae]
MFAGPIFVLLVADEPYWTHDPPFRLDEAAGMTALALVTILLLLLRWSISTAFSVASAAAMLILDFLGGFWKNTTFRAGNCIVFIVLLALPILLGREEDRVFLLSARLTTPLLLWRLLVSYQPTPYAIFSSVVYAVLVISAIVAFRYSRRERGYPLPARCQARPPSRTKG